jgi:predicted dehydrogenase
MPLDILVVGGGSIGERHVRCFQDIGCEVALCDSNAARLREMSDRYKLSRTFQSIEAAARETWYGVVIATPANLHAEHAAMLIKSTEALLIEKPLCTSLDQADRLMSLAAGKWVQVGYVLRHHPATQHVRMLLAEGVIGKLHQVTVTAGQNFPSLRPAYREIYYKSHATGGGAVQDAATHLFDLVQHLAGPFDWILCDYAHQELADVEVEDTVHIIGRCRVNTMVSIALNQFMAPNESHVQLNGALGSLAIEFHEHRAGMFMLGDADWTWTEPLVAERDDLFRAQAQNFISSVVKQDPWVCTLDDDLRALAVNLAALRSGQNHTIEPILSPVSTLPPSR